MIFISSVWRMAQILLERAFSKDSFSSFTPYSMPSLISFYIISTFILSLETRFSRSEMFYSLSIYTLIQAFFEFIHSLSRNYSMEYRWFLFIYRQPNINSFSQWSILGFSGIRTFSSVTFCMNTVQPLSMGKGSFPKMSWNKMTPMDQMSHFLSQGLLRRTQGAMVMGVPQQVCIMNCSLLNSLANPKSASLIVKSFLSRMLASFISLWAMPFACRWWIASAMQVIIFFTQSGFSRISMFYFKYFSRSPFSQYSKMRQQLLEVYSVSCRLTMLGCEMLLIISTSLAIISFCYLLIDRILIILMAYFSSSPSFLPSNTSLVAPEPIFFNNLQLPIFFTVQLMSFKLYAIRQKRIKGSLARGQRCWDVLI